MKNKIIYIVLFIILIMSCDKNNVQELAKNNLDSLLARINKSPYYRTKIPIVYSEPRYTIICTDSMFGFELSEKEIMLYDSSFVVGNSIIFDNKLLTLSASGYLNCFDLERFEHDVKFEKMINTYKMDNICKINNTLLISSNNKLFKWQNNNWNILNFNLPTKNLPIIYDDDKYYVFTDYWGEWGGTVYFYNKSTNRIHFTEATHANSIIKINQVYIINCLTEGSVLKEIANPELLPIVSEKYINTKFRGSAWGYLDSSEVAKEIFYYGRVYNVGLFRYRNQSLYFTNFDHNLFLSTIQNDTIKIMHPLFNRPSIIPYKSICRQDSLFTLVSLFYDNFESPTQKCGLVERDIILVNKNKISYIHWLRN